MLKFDFMFENNEVLEEFKKEFIERFPAAKFVAIKYSENLSYTAQAIVWLPTNLKEYSNYALLSVEDMYDFCGLIKKYHVHELSKSWIPLADSNVINDIITDFEELAEPGTLRYYTLSMFFLKLICVDNADDIVTFYPTEFKNVVKGYADEYIDRETGALKITKEDHTCECESTCVECNCKK